MRQFSMLVAVVVFGMIGCTKPTEPNYTVTTEVVRRNAPPPILINPLGSNADGMTGFQVGATQFLMSQDREALVRSVVADAVAIRDRTGVSEVRIGNGKYDTDNPETKEVEAKLKELKFTVTVVPKAAE